MRRLIWIFKYLGVFFGSLAVEAGKCHEYAVFSADIAARRRVR